MPWPMRSELEIFKEYIQTRGLRQTPEREKILREIVAIEGHFDVDELYLRLRHQGSKISKASIYRTLPLLVDCGLIREVDYTDGHWHYEHIYGLPHHCHLRCLECGAIVEFEEALLTCVEQKLAWRFGYIITNHTLEVQGYCPECQEKWKAGETGGG
jgi:Fur family ferric uptake transcriptional regulator